MRRSAGILFNDLPPRTARVVVPVSLAGVVLIGAAVAEGVGFMASAILLLLVASILAEAFPVRIEGVTAGATSFANVFIVAAAAIYGWRAGALVGGATMLAVEIYSRQRPARLILNASLYALSGAAAGWFGQAVDVTHLRGFAAAFAFYGVNVAVLSAVVASSRGEPYLKLAGSFFLSTLTPGVVMSTMSVILIGLWRHSPYDMLLLAPPLVAIVVYQRSLMRAMERQRELDDLKNEFIAVISHELRTPLTSVYGSAVTLEERRVDEPTRDRLIGIIRRESTRLTELVEDVLWASRLDAKKANRNPVPCDVATLARDVCAVAAEIAPPGIEVVVADGGEGVCAVADEEGLRRVLGNLVDNAVKYSPGGGVVQVTPRLVGNRVRVTVSDEGVGVPEDERERIFEKFLRLDPHMTHGIPGTGLGLFICRELVVQMGGRIWVNGNDNGRGSTFGFELPALVTEGEGSC